MYFSAEIAWVLFDTSRRSPIHDTAAFYLNFQRTFNFVEDPWSWVMSHDIMAFRQRVSSLNSTRCWLLKRHNNQPQNRTIRIHHMCYIYSNQSMELYIIWIRGLQSNSPYNLKAAHSQISPPPPHPTPHRTIIIHNCFVNKSCGLLEWI